MRATASLPMPGWSRRAWPFRPAPAAPDTESRGLPPGTERTSLHHFRNDEKVILGRRRVLHDQIGNLAVGHHVWPLLHPHRRHRGHRLDAFDIDLRELLEKGQNGVELALEMRDFVLGHGNPGELCDAADGRSVDGHANFP